MDDARNLQYGIGFDTADAETSVENLGEKVETLEENIGAVEVGAQQMGASAVSAARWGRERPSASPGLSVMLRVGWMIWLPVHPKQAMRPKRRRVIGT